MATNPGLPFDNKPAPRKEPPRKEQKGKPDTVLDRSAIAKDYGYALKVIYANPELKALFEQAVNDKTGVWTASKFTAALMNTDWWNSNSEPAREAWAAWKMGTNPDGTPTADWTDTQNLAASAVDAYAAEIGATLTPEERDSFIHRYIFEGWKDPRRAGLMAKAFSEQIDPSKGLNNGKLLGKSGDLEEELRSIASANGLMLDNSYFVGAARSVAAGLTTANDWIRDVRSQASSLWPGWQDKIMAGANAKDMASGYINTMAQTLELDPSQISLDDPLLRQAVTKVDEKGNPSMVGLWDFTQMLRKDERWMHTSQATNNIAGIANDVMKMFGLLGA